MDLLGLMAVRALLEMRNAYREVGTAIALSSVRDSPFGNAHSCDFSFRSGAASVLRGQMAGPGK
jgi:hypothetical protein